MSSFQVTFSWRRGQLTVGSESWHEGSPKQIPAEEVQRLLDDLSGEADVGYFRERVEALIARQKKRRSAP